MCVNFHNILRPSARALNPDARQAAVDCTLCKKGEAYALAVPARLVRALGWEDGDMISMHASGGALAAKKQAPLPAEGYAAQALKAIEKTAKGAAEERRTQPADGSIT